MLSLYCLGRLVCVILHGLSTLARGHFAMDSSKKKPGRPKNKPRGKPANPDVSHKLPKTQRKQREPRTPERFWDPDIIEDSADDPRNKIFHASPLRKRREEKAFEVGEVVNGDEFE